MNVRTYANGFGIWHAVVTDFSPDEWSTAARRAQRAIKAELVERGAPTSYRVRIRPLAERGRPGRAVFTEV